MKKQKGEAKRGDFMKKKTMRGRVARAGFVGMFFVAAIALLVIIPRLRSAEKNTYQNYMESLALAYGKSLDEQIMIAEDPSEILTQDVLADLVSDACLTGYETSYCYVVDPETQLFYYHPEEDRVGTAVENEIVIALAEDIVSTGTVPDPGFESYVNRGSTKYLAYYCTSGGEAILCIVVNVPEFMAPINRLTFWGIGAGFVALLLFTAIGYWFAGVITHPVITVTEQMDRMASLDFTSDGEIEKITTNRDETGAMSRSLVHLRQILVETITDIQRQSEQLFSASEELQNGTNETTETFGNIEVAVGEIAQGATSQATETQNATDNVVVIGTMIEDTKSQVEALNYTAGEIAKSNQQASDALRQLTEINRKTIESIDMIEKQTRTTNESASKIKDAALLIANIAEETNLLSLNASIEAARAGEAGRGFAVVATQIQKLAEQSNESAQQIDQVVSELVTDSNTAVETMGEVSTIVKQQSEFLSDTAEMFRNVESGVGESVSGIQMIADQTVSLDEARNNIIDVVQNLTAIAEENAASTQETSASVTEVDAIMQDISTNANNLRKIAGILEEHVKRFNI